MKNSYKFIKVTQILEELKRIRRTLISESNFQQEFLTEISVEQKKIFKKLNIYLPII